MVGSGIACAGKAEAEAVAEAEAEGAASVAGTEKSASEGGGLVIPRSRS